MSASDVVGVVGTGNMGSLFVERFTAAGCRVLAYDTSPASLDRAIAAGGTACASPAELASQCDYVHVMVRGDEQVLACCLDPDGVLAGIRPGTPLLLNSSISPRTTFQVAASATEAGVPLVDACITAIPAVLKAGNGATLIGGERSLVERLTPHLLRLVKDVIYTGPLGSGNAAKAAHNLAVIVEQLIVHEALQLMSAAGVSPEAAAAVIRHAYDTRSLDGFDGYDAVPPARNLFQTILPMAQTIADDHGIDVPLLRALGAKPADR